ncbi:MAG: bifunctional molybdenum cofactor biosynthesis protein MoaC/MoaB [Nitrososphaera sp.]|jgi:molybdenum cofactor biosynthesis protein MoaC
MAGEGTPGMVDISAKPDTLRSAVARATVKIGSPATMEIINEGKSPKGNIFDAARIAATMGAKRTWDLLPYCHPLPLDSIKVDIAARNLSVEITVSVKAVWKTGVEMEALTGASIAALTVYDMLKPVDDGLSIESIKLIEKRGGLNSFAEKFDRRLTAAVLVASDSRHEKDDVSGKVVAKRLGEQGFQVVSFKIVPDDVHRIAAELKEFCDDLKVDLVMTTGGTGFGQRDVTPEATKAVIEKEAAGIMEALRAHGQKRTPLSMLSRGVAGVRGKTVIVNLPGSTRAVSESLDSVFPGLLHLYRMMEGLGHNH